MEKFMRTNLIGKNEATISNIFENRGINPNSIFRLNEEALIDPREVQNLEEAVKLAQEKMVSGSDLIGIVQDPDADGYTSTAIIFNYLAECYPEQRNRLTILIHEDKTHGIPVDLIKEMTKEGKKFDLIIAPDCSSNEEDVHKQIVENYDIPIVILDHHEADKFSDYAVMVNISLDSYPNKCLSGAGVCVKFIQLYDEIFGFEFGTKYYDLAAIGIISDMIEINQLETIYMVQEGMRNIHNLFLKTLYDAKKFNLGGQVTPIGISFYISPVINAMTRVGTLEEKKELARAMVVQETEDIPSTKRGAKEGDTETIHSAIVRKMNNIKARQDRLRDAASNKLLEQIETSGMTNDQIFILDLEGEYPDTFNGLIANRVMGEYKKPTLVGSHVSINGVDFFKGSARGDDKSDLPELKKFNNDSGLFEYAEGHEGAHGFMFEADKKEEIVEYFNDKLKDITFEPVHQIDFDIDFKELSMDALSEITRYSTFWGRGLEEPVFVLRNVPVKKETVDIAGSFGDHKIVFESGGLKFIKFKGVTTEAAQRLKSNMETLVDVVGTIKLSSYQGKTFYQVFIKDIELITSKKYVF